MLTRKALPLLAFALVAGSSLQAQELLSNGGFEQGATGWSGATSKIVTTGTHYEGTRHAALLNVGRTATENLTTTVNLPADATKITLGFALQISTKETTTTTIYDKLAVQVLNPAGTVLGTLVTYSNLNKNAAYALRSFDLTSYKGQTVQLRFLGTEDSSLATTFNLDAVSVRADKGTPTAGLDLSVAQVFVTQATQKADRSVPLIADRRGLLRVFVKASETNTAKPVVKVTAFHDALEVGTYTLNPNAAMTGVPTVVTETDYTQTYQTVLPASVFKPGLRFRVQVDPTNAVAESNEANNIYEGSAENLKVLAPFKTMLVPLKPPTGTTSIVSTANAETYVEFLRRLQPVPEALDVKVHAPYTTSVTISSSYDTTWSTVLNEVDALRKAEGDLKRHYYGCIASHTNGGTGMANIGGFAAIGVEWTNNVSGGTSNWKAGTYAHEVGHNLGRRHAPCGGAGGPDPSYPYADGEIGANGYDVWTGKNYNANSGWTDVMGYCGYDWISDYGYKLSLNWRLSNDPAPAARAAMGAEQDCLLTWGRVEEDGRVIMEPAFVVKGVPDVADPAGAYELEVDFGAGTVRDFFNADDLDHLRGKTFTRLVALPSTRAAAAPNADGETQGVTSGVLDLRLKRGGEILAQGARTRSLVTSDASEEVRAVRVEGRTTKVFWDAAAFPVAMVRDARSGQVLSFARNGEVEVLAPGRLLEVQLSNGTRQVTRTVRIR